MSEAFGFDEMINKLDNYERLSSEGQKVTKEYADKMRDKAEQYFVSGLRQRTGQGASGINVEHSGEVSEVGWDARPGLHGYFHELGFHALDNRRRTLGRKKKWNLKRGVGSNRPRIYKGVIATYVPPTPHMRPAFYDYEKMYHKDAQERVAPN